MGEMSLAEMFDRSMDILKRNLKHVILYNLCFGMICLGVIYIGLIILVLAGVITFQLTTSPVLIIFIVFLSFILMISMYLCMDVGMIKIASTEFMPEQLEIGKLIKLGFSKFFRLLCVTAMMFVTLLPAIGIFAFFGYTIYVGAKSVDFNTPGLTTSAVFILIIMFIYALLASFVFLVYSVIFEFAVHSVTIENKGAFSSLRRSIQLVSGDFWRLFGCTILIGLVLYAINMSLYNFLLVLFSLLYGLLKLVNIHIDYFSFFYLVYMMLSWPLSIISALIIAPIGKIIVTMFYFNQRFKKEGLDLELKLIKLRFERERKRAGEFINFGSTNPNRI